MSTPETPARPAQVTVAAWAIAFSSVLLLVFVFDALGSLHTIDVRDDLAERIRSGNLKGFGISVAEAVTVKRWALYVTGLASVITGILAVYVLRRDKAARIVLSVAAVPIVLAVPFTGSFLAMLIGAATAVIWSRPGRDWYAGRVTVAPVLRQPGVRPPGPAPYGQTPGPPISLKDLPPPGAVAPYPAYAPAPTYVEPPRQVRIACVLTWVFSTITSLGSLVALAAITIDQQGLIDQVKKSSSWDPSNDDQLIVTAAVVVSILCLAWCAAAATVAVFAWRGQRWAWIVLLVLMVPATILAVRVFPYSLVHLAALGSTFGMLWSAPAREWFKDPRPPGGSVPR